MRVSEANPITVDGIAVDYSTLPETRGYNRESIRLYIEHRCDPGAGWRMILAHDLWAVLYCDAETVRGMREICLWLHNYAPSACHGSRERVEAWLRRKT